MGKTNRPVISSVSVLVAGVKQQPNSSCAFYGKKDHETVNCSQAKDERWKQVKDKKSCFNCLRPTNNFIILEIVDNKVVLLKVVVRNIIGCCIKG